MSALLEPIASMLLTLALHATVLLGGAWLLERSGALRHPAVAELVWRGALFGALVATALSWLPLPERAPFDGAAATAVTGVGVSERQAGSAVTSRDAGPPAVTPAAAPARAAVPASHASGTASPPSRAAAPPPRSSRDASPARLALPPWLLTALVLAWTATVLGAGLRLLLQLTAARRLVRTRHADPPAALRACVAELARCLGIGAPRLRVGDDHGSPLVLTDGSVLLPRWATKLPAEQQRAMLAHELGHLARRDPHWRIAQAIALLPLGFHPFAHLAQRRLDALAEDACDATSARLLGDGRPLAECLAQCLSHSRSATAPALAFAMAGDRRPVVRRVSRLLENPPMSTHALSPVRRRLLLLSMIVAIVALGGVAVTTVAGERGSTRSVQITRDDDSVRFREMRPGHAMDVEIEGRIDFAADESAVEAMADGARLDIAESSGGVMRRVELRGGSAGIERRYWVDRDERPFDAEAAAWLARTLPEMFRQSGLRADARVQRLLARGGSAAVFAEIGRIRTDSSRSAHLRALVEAGPLDAAELATTLELAKAIESDFELRRVLQSLAARPSLDVPTQRALLQVARGIDSDFELAELLIGFVAQHPLQGEVAAAWREAQQAIGSDFEQRRVLQAGLDARPDAAGLVLMLDGAQRIDSSFELRSVLASAAPLVRSDEARAAWFAAARRIDSDFERRSALAAMVDAAGNEHAVAAAILEATADIGSDFETGEVLQALAMRMPQDAALIEQYRSVARRLGNHERGRAERALDRFASR